MLITLVNTEIKMKRLYGIGGKKRSGKNMLAREITLEATRSGKTVEMFAFADPIKNCLAEIFKYEMHPMYFTEDRYKDHQVRVSGAKSMSVREILQIVGTECFRDNIDPSFWIRRAFERYKQSQADIVIITDVRFENEVDMINTHGTSILVERTGHTSDDSHRSETELDKIDYLFTWTVAFPDGDRQGMTNFAKTIIKDIDER